MMALREFYADILDYMRILLLLVLSTLQPGRFVGTSKLLETRLLGATRSIERYFRLERLLRDLERQTVACSHALDLYQQAFTNGRRLQLHGGNGDASHHPPSFVDQFDAISRCAQQLTARIALSYALIDVSDEAQVNDSRRLFALCFDDIRRLASAIGDADAVSRAESAMIEYFDDPTLPIADPIPVKDVMHEKLKAEDEAVSIDFAKTDSACITDETSNVRRPSRLDRMIYIKSV